MSGGHFNYDQYRIGDAADEVERLIRLNDTPPNENWDNDFGHGFPETVIKKFKEGLKHLRLAQVYLHRIDWLVSGDDGDDSFLGRLEEELKALNLEYKDNG